MAYDFLGLVNDVAGRLNEVQLTSSNFASAGNHYIMIKEAVNTAIREINQDQFAWPFNHTTQNDTLTADGTIRYSLQSDAKSVDWGSFRIRRDATFGNESQPLRILSYEEYLDKYVDAEYNTSDTGIRDLSRSVFRTPDQKYGVYPPPDNAYALDYEYYQLPSDLSSATDVPSIPVAFRHVIVDGASVHAYMHRGDVQRAGFYGRKFKKGIQDLRTLYINRYDYVRSTYLSQAKTDSYVVETVS